MCVKRFSIVKGKFYMILILVSISFLINNGDYKDSYKVVRWVFRWFLIDIFVGWVYFKCG